MGHFAGQQRFRPSRLAILSPYTPARSAIPSPLAGLELTDQLDRWQRDEAVWFSTIKAFKGLEADIVLLADLGAFKPGVFERRDLYVAASRARHRLICLAGSPEVGGVLRAARG